MMKRISSMLFTVAAVFFCSASVSAETFEAGGIFYKTTSETEVEVTKHPDKIWGYIGDFFIPETVTHEGKTYSVTAVGERAFANNNYLKHITLASITEIKKEAFVGCESLLNVISAPKLKVIGEKAFAYCSKLAAFQFPPTLLRIENQAFFKCYKLYNFTLPDNLEYLGESVFYDSGFFNFADGAVYSGKALIAYIGTAPETFTVKEGTTIIADNIITFNEGLKTVNIPSSVKLIGNEAFFACSNLTNVNFANRSSIEFVGDRAFGETAWLEAQPDGEIYIGKAFYSYKGYLPKNTSIIIKEGTKMISGYALSGTALKSVTIPGSVVEIGYQAFQDCGLLETVNFSEGLKYIRGRAFSLCKSQSSIALPKSVELIKDEVFTGNFKLQNINVDEGNKNYCSVDGVLFSKDKKILVAFPASRTGDYIIPDSVEDIVGGAFDCTKLTSVTVPANITEIKASNFDNCDNLENITFKTPSRIKSFAPCVIAGCPNLKSIVLPDSLEYVDYYSLNNCISLAEITFPETLKNMRDGVFEETKWFDAQPDGVVYAGNLALKVKGNVPENIVIRNGTERINRYFLSYSDIKSITFPESLQYIGEKALFNCPNLTEISGGLNADTGLEVFRETPWYSAEEEKDTAIYYGKSVIGIKVGNLVNLDIKEGTEYFNAGKDDFEGRKFIDKVTLPRSLKKISQKPFKDIEIKESITVKSPIPPVFDGDPCIYDILEAKLIVPESCLDAYRNAPGWRLFGNIVGDPNLGGVEAVETDDNIRVFADGENIVIEGVEEGTPVEVFNLNGQTVYSGVETLINVADKGIYIVRVDGRAYKVAM